MRISEIKTLFNANRKMSYNKISSLIDEVIQVERDNFLEALEREVSGIVDNTSLETVKIEVKKLLERVKIALKQPYREEGEG